MLLEFKVSDCISIAGISIAFFTIITLYWRRNHYPVKQQSFLLSLFFIIFSISMFIIRLFYESPLDACATNQLHQKIFCSFQDNWIYIVLANHYRFFVICQLQEDRQLQLVELSQQGEDADDQIRKKDNSFSIKGKFYSLDITNNVWLNQIISKIFLNEIICVMIIIMLILLNALVQSFLNSDLLDEIEDIVTQLLFLHVIYLQGKLIYEFQQKTQLILLLLLRDIIESMDIIEYRRVYIYYLLIFLIQAVGPLFLSFYTKEFKLFDTTDLYNIPLGEGIQIQVFEQFKQQTQNDSIQDFRKTVSFNQLTKMATLNQRVKDTLCNFGLF